MRVESSAVPVHGVAEVAVVRAAGVDDGGHGEASTGSVAGTEAQAPSAAHEISDVSAAIAVAGMPHALARLLRIFLALRRARARSRLLGSFGFALEEATDED